MLAFLPGNFVENLKYMLVGMIGVFMIVSIIMAATYLVGSLTSKNENKDNDE